MKNKPNGARLRLLTPVYIYDALRDLLPFVHFKKREKHLWTSVIFSKVPD